jgi:hypothetical protein
MRKLYLGLLILMMLISVTGCEGDNDSATLSTLNISSDMETVARGGQIELTVIGEDEEGYSMFVEPEWKITKGPGAIYTEGSQVIYYATDHDFSGEVEIQATVDNKTAVKTIIVELLLGAEPVIWPEVDNMDDILPYKTETVETVGQPLDFYRVNQMVHNYSQGILHIRPIVYLENGNFVDPYDSLSYGKLWNYIYANDGKKLPEKIYLSTRVYYKLLGSVSFEYPDSSKWTKSVTYGTTKTKATEFAKETSAELSAEGSWGWGSVQATVSETIQKKTTESFSIMEENTTDWGLVFYAKEDKPKTLGGVYQREVVFYLSDSVGVPIDESAVFKDYKLPAREFTVQTENYRGKSWHFE